MSSEPFASIGRDRYPNQAIEPYAVAAASRRVSNAGVSSMPQRSASARVRVSSVTPCYYARAREGER
jgi:hypothetical protein